ncbi:hypothetical protein ACFV4F_00445 [Kitasatospora sp. NPDC059722]
MTVGRHTTAAAPASVRTPVPSVLTARRYIDHALTCSACCR